MLPWSSIISGGFYEIANKLALQVYRTKSGDKRVYPDQIQLSLTWSVIFVRQYIE